MHTNVKPLLFRLVLSSAMGMILCCAPIDAQAADRGISNPRVLGEGISPKGLWQAPIERLPHERRLELDIVYTKGQIYNPAIDDYDEVYLRSYNGTDVDPSTPYVSPTIEVVPGDTVLIKLSNKLPGDPGCSSSHEHQNVPHCANGTNLHTHGLWVNPAGNGDNVLLSINPGVNFEYEYKIPSDHPAGTFWYHTHRHGSTALQVSSGMAGALIVRGARLPTATTQGDIDTLLSGFPERTLVFQQIQYACYEKNPDGSRGTVKRGPDGKTYRCDKGDVGEIETYDLFAPNQWRDSGRYTSLNGVVLPTFTTQAGQIERWRMIHGGVRDTISLKLVEMKSDAKIASKLSREDEQSFIKASCNGKTIPYHLVAADGLTMAAAQNTKLATFQPGYRFDALIVYPSSGRYCLIDASSPSAGSVNGDTPVPALLGYVDVKPGTEIPDVSAHVEAALVASANARFAPDVAQSVVADLQAGLKFSRFIPHQPIPDAEVTGSQELTFNIANGVFGISNTASAADAQAFDQSRVDRKLTLGSVDEWTLRSAVAGHPFHIHVNPFEIISITDPNGRDVSVAGVIDDTGGTVDPQYGGLKGVWKDTLWVKGAPGGGMYTVKIRTRYQRYVGQFVLHCHILDHEDQGMMQKVEVILPEGDLNSPPAKSGQHKHK